MTTGSAGEREQEVEVRDLLHEEADALSGTYYVRRATLSHGPAT